MECKNFSYILRIATVDIAAIKHQTRKLISRFIHKNSHSELGLKIRSNGLDRIDQRLRAIRWASKNIVAIKPVNDKETKNNEEKIFCYWGQGFDHAPQIVHACKAQLIAHHPPEKLVFLTDATIRNYVDIPDDVIQKMASQKTAFSDLLRVALLSKHGGFWVDATCYCTTNLFSVTKICDSQFFAFSNMNSRARISSWFLYSARGSYVATRIYDVMLHYWKKKSQPMHYYMFHDFIESLYFLDPHFATQWDKMPRLHRLPPHKLQEAQSNLFDKVLLDKLMAQSFIHKLTYKLKPGQDLRGTIYEHISTDRGF